MILTTRRQPPAPPAVIPFARPETGQPRPIGLWLATSKAGDSTVIVRAWKPGDTDRCGLCPESTCSARQNVCVVMVDDEYVADDQAALWRRDDESKGGSR